ncbi:helix-turn-helix domain-containing protein [Actinoplanes rectilineatus]|uniref:helix-turn-helix domain-containing protein n=1 Tax=Actinoplanes rectilineatus TaxID=113571 RepID=UPI0005F2A74C|nr:helix-turn-helix transcriptional regulator [Actinoplanes rectilineatus]
MTDTITPPIRALTLAEEVTLTRLPAPHIRRAIRDAANVSLRRLAREIRVSHGSIAYYERGGQPGTEIAIRYREQLERLASAVGFNIPVDTQT